MALSPADQEIVAAMKQREFHLKRRQRAADALLHEERLYRATWVAEVAVLVTTVVTAISLAVIMTLPDRPGGWRLALINGVVAAVLGVLLGQSMMRTGWGRQRLANHEIKLREKYRGDLHAGRRWLQFYYRGDDISAYVPQILHFLEGDRRFDSVDAALSFIKAHHQEGPTFPARALDIFSSVAAQTNLVVVSTTNEAGQPSSRIMNFVRADNRPGVWFVTTAPEGPKVAELDRGRVALVTLPTETGATISSNRVQIRRAAVPFSAVAHLYRAQVPSYAKGMTEDEQEQELVYEMLLQSARVDTWLDHELVDFCHPGTSAAES